MALDIMRAVDILESFRVLAEEVFGFVCEWRQVAIDHAINAIDDVPVRYEQNLVAVILHV